MDPVVSRIKAKIAQERLSQSDAAAQIGVTSSSLVRHLSGSYVRSDSLAKYRRWISGEGKIVPHSPLASSGTPPTLVASGLADQTLLEGWEPPPRPHYVVDLFSGCGGLSLGFELARDGAAFKSVLALDIEEPMVRCFNANFKPREPTGPKVGRHSDLADFINEAEVLAFYLDHLAGVTNDKELRRELDVLPCGSVSELKTSIAAHDAAFVALLRSIRNSAEFRVAYAQLESNVMAQTSVAGFQQALGLPALSSKLGSVPPLIWADAPVTGAAALLAHPMDARRRGALSDVWEAERAQLIAKSKAKGPGQLASSSAKIGSFVRFLEKPVMNEVKLAWLDWRAARDHRRSAMFWNHDALNSLQKLYTEARQADVILGGPPCQGFSLIGRGKTKSLREHGVHVQEDAAVGDARNRLLLKYTLFVAALRPRIFLFENVSHFKAEVKTQEGTFRATEVLGEAIREIAGGGIKYSVAITTVDCSAHSIPQNRARFVMCGIRSDVEADISQPEIAAWLLRLPPQPTVPLRTALEGLPAPVVVGPAGDGRLDSVVQVESLTYKEAGPRATYIEWIQKAPLPQTPSLTRKPNSADGHAIRASRRDDSALFHLMGPGTRWMDYRCESSPTLKDLAEVLRVVTGLARTAQRGPSRDGAAKQLRALDMGMLKRLGSAVNGSLSLRLLLECIEPLPGELTHHLLAPKYLAKRSGHHGDWLARMDPDKPSKTIVSHMSKDTYMYVHPFAARTLSVREAARIQTFPDWFCFGSLGLVDGFRVIGNAVPPLLSHGFAMRVGEALAASALGRASGLKARAAT